MVVGCLFCMSTAIHSGWSKKNEWRKEWKKERKSGTFVIPQKLFIDQYFCAR